MRARDLHEEGGRRTVALVFEKDDEVIETLRSFAREHELPGGHFTAVGAFREATLAYFDWDTRAYEDIPVREQVEVASLMGDIAMKEGGEVAVHAHCVLGRRDGSTIAGHLRKARVRPTLELFLTVSERELRRAPDPESGLDLLRP